MYQINKSQIKKLFNNQDTVSKKQLSDYYASLGLNKEEEQKQIEYLLSKSRITEIKTNTQIDKNGK